jgi:hypothetical protein
MQTQQPRNPGAQDTGKDSRRALFAKTVLAAAAGLLPAALLTAPALAFNSLSGCKKKCKHFSGNCHSRCQRCCKKIFGGGKERCNFGCGSIRPKR